VRVCPCGGPPSGGRPCNQEFDVGEVSGDAMEDGVRDTVRTAGTGWCWEAFALVDIRAHSERSTLGGTAGMLKH
jgi:hypothetical protein